MIKKDDNREDLAHIRDSLEPFKDYHVPGGIPEFRKTDFPISVKIGKYEKYENASDFELSLLARVNGLEDRVEKLEDHTEIHKESFNDFN